MGTSEQQQQQERDVRLMFSLVVDEVVSDYFWILLILAEALDSLLLVMPYVSGEIY